MPDSRVLIAYASHFGQTAKVASFVADELRSSGCDVTLARVNDLPRTIAPGRFDGALVGASVNYGRHQRSIRRFVRANRGELERIPSAFFSVSGAAGSPDEAARASARQYIERFLSDTGWHPAMSESVAGAMPYTKYSPLIRWVIKKISVKEGGPTDTTRDYEFTDWEQVRRFTQRFAAVLPSPEGAGARAEP